MPMWKVLAPWMVKLASLIDHATTWGKQDGDGGADTIPTIDSVQTMDIVGGRVYYVSIVQLSKMEPLCMLLQSLRAGLG